SLFLSSPPAPIHIYPLSLHDALPILTTTPESSALRLAAGRNARPSAGVTRSTEKKLLETTSIATISPRPLVLTKAPRPPCARTPANRVLSPECRGNPETRTEPPAPFSLPVKTDAS